MEIAIQSRSMPYLLVLIISAFIWPFSLMAASVPLSISIDHEGETLLLTLPDSRTASIFTLHKPERLVVDISHTDSTPQIALPGDYAGRLVKSIRSGQFTSTTGRLVFELTQPVQYQHSQSGRDLSITLTPKNSVTSPEPLKSPPPKPLIVIDPGHGGQDPGATGKRRTREKDLVLSYAKALEKALNNSGKYEARLTRNGDYYIALRERFAYARQQGAKLFISIHADSAPGSARGLSIYTLSETASDKETETLAANENRSDIIAGIDLGGQDPDVTNILISLAQRETNNKSILLGDSIVAAMANHKVDLLDNTHRYAGFAVLKAPDIPSVLIEVGFLSNQEEEKRLNDGNHRAKVVKAMQQGIDKYFALESK